MRFFGLLSLIDKAISSLIDRSTAGRLFFKASQTPEFMNGGGGSEATNTLNALSTRLGLPTLDHP